MTTLDVIPAMLDAAATDPLAESIGLIAGSVGATGLVAYAAIKLVPVLRHGVKALAQRIVSKAEIRKVEAEAGAQVAVAKEQGAAAALPVLADVIKQMREERKAERAEDRAACSEELRRSEEHCVERVKAEVATATAPLNAEIATLAARVRKDHERARARESTPHPVIGTEYGDEITGVTHVIEELAGIERSASLRAIVPPPRDDPEDP